MTFEVKQYSRCRAKKLVSVVAKYEVRRILNGKHSRLPNCTDESEPLEAMLVASPAQLLGNSNRWGAMGVVFPFKKVDQPSSPSRRSPRFPFDDLPPALYPDRHCHSLSCICRVRGALHQNSLFPKSCSQRSGCRGEYHVRNPRLLRATVHKYDMFKAVPGVSPWFVFELSPHE